MPDRPAPVTDLAWSPQQAEELGTRVVAVWTELLQRLPDQPVTAPRPPAEVAPAVALPVGAGGMVMTVGAMANFVGLKCARDQQVGLGVREAGVAADGPVALYTS